MERGRSGEFALTTVGGEAVRAFIPDALPPDIALDITGGRYKLLEQATLAMGRMDSITMLLPDTNLFIYSYVRREAVLSSQIEGTQSSLSDLMLYEIGGSPGIPFNDVIAVSNYVRALEHGMARIREGFPLTGRLLRELHEILLTSGRGADRMPGLFRVSQNWIGGTRPGNAHFVPPPAAEIAQCISDLERFIHADTDSLPTLIRIALAHVQFETIHPFLDGNGRIGRLLISLMLHYSGILSQPLLYLSLYFKEYRAVYYKLLDDVRMYGNWEAWIDFFLEGVLNTANATIRTTTRLVDMFKRDADILLTENYRNPSVRIVFEALRHQPLTSITRLSATTGLTFATVNRAVGVLGQAGIVSELTGSRRNRVYAYTEYVAILNEGTENPLS